IKDRGHQLGSVYEQELKKKISSTIEFNSKINDLNERLQAKNSEYLKREKEFQHEQKSHSESRYRVSYDFLRLELKRVKEDLNSKEYTIECMEKGIEENRSLRDQLVLDGLERTDSYIKSGGEKNNEPESSSAPSKQIIPATISKEKISLGVVVKKLRNLESIMPKEKVGYPAHKKYINREEIPDRPGITPKYLP
ncbi:24303_t:CDS:2, partial [Gigaspora margarita]